jgi:hypothetical protein
MIELGGHWFAWTCLPCEAEWLATDCSDSGVLRNDRAVA